MNNLPRIKMLIKGKKDFSCHFSFKISLNSSFLVLEIARGEVDSTIFVKTMDREKRNKYLGLEQAFQTVFSLQMVKKILSLVHNMKD